MVLYAADLDEIAPTKKIGRKRKTDKVEEPVEESPQTVEKKKRQLSEKQKEALKKGQAARQLKKELAQKEKEEEEALKEKLLAAAPKKRVSKKKDVAKKPEVESEVEPEPEPEPEPVQEKEKPRKRIKKENKPENLQVAKRKKKAEPPTWFKEYVEGVQKEKAAAKGEVSKKQETIIKNEALKMAKKSWESGYTRDRVQNEVDNHSNFY